MMPHDELLKVVNWSVELAEAQYLQELLNQMKALRAVVELHKPWNTDKFGEPIDVCVGCFDVTDDHIVYPCPTIRAIEKELI
jgi:hypothetical protein